MGPPDAPGGIYAEGIHGGGQEDDHEPSPSERAAAAAEARMRGDRDGGDAGARSEGGGSGRRRADWSGFTVTGMRDNGGVAFTYNFGGPGAGGREGGARRDGDGAPEAPAQNLASFLQRAFGNPNPEADRADGDGQDHGAMPLPMQQLLQMLGGPTFGSGQLGDYALSQQGLDNIISQLMEQASGQYGPKPAPDEMIKELPRFTINEKILAEEGVHDCSVCKDDFVVGDKVLRLPCSHIFHDEDCIVPWLKQSGTCPVCRYALVEQPAPPPGPGSGPGAGPRSPNVRPPETRASPDVPNSPSTTGSWFSGFPFGGGGGGGQSSAGGSGSTSGSAAASGSGSGRGTNSGRSQQDSSDGSRRPGSRDDVLDMDALD